MTENTIPSASLGSDLVRGDSSTGDLSEAQVGTAKLGGVSPMVVPPHKKFPLLLLLLIPILVIVAVIAIYILLQARTMYQETIPSPSPMATPIASADPTASWETYVNTKHNYSFKYPNELTVRPFAGSQDDPVEAAMFKLDPEIGETYALVAITPKTTDPTVGLLVGTSINGYDTYYKNHPNGVPSDKTPISIVEIHNSGKSVQFIFRNISELNYQAKQILSTFSFTDSSGSNIYSNKKLGVSFEIPDGLVLDTEHNKKYDSEYWQIKLNIQGEDSILIQNGSPAGWTDCKKNIDEKSGKIDTLEYGYFKEVDDFESCKLEGASTYVGWYAVIRDGPIDRNDNQSWFISANTESTDQIYRQKIETMFFKILNTFKSLDVLP